MLGMELWPTVFWGMLVVAAILGWAATLLVQHRLWLVVLLAFGGIGLAMVYVSGADPTHEYEGLGRMIWAGFPLVGWLLGLAATSVWIVGRRMGEKSRNRSRAARS